MVKLPAAIVNGELSMPCKVAVMVKSLYVPAAVPPPPGWHICVRLQTTKPPEFVPPTVSVPGGAGNAHAVPDMLTASVPTTAFA
jgi:hypothetical protein